MIECYGRSWSFADVSLTVGGRVDGGICSAISMRGRWRWRVSWNLVRRGRLAKEHEDVPDAELCRERDGVVEEREVPTRAVSGGCDAVLVLQTKLDQSSARQTHGTRKR